MNQKMLKKMMDQAQQMQSGVMRVQEELAEARVEGMAAEGLVRATVTGQGELVEIRISPDAVDPSDVEMLEDLILVAVRNAVASSRELSRNRMEALGLPGIGGLM